MRRTPALVAVAGLVLALSACGEQGAGDAAEPAAEETTPAAPTVTDLLVEGKGDQRCAAPSATFLRTVDQAAAGTVIEVADKRIVLDVDHWYTGEETDQIALAPGAGIPALTLTTNFEQGQRYLVSATDGVVTVCGYTAPYSKDLADLYDEAF